MMNNKKDILKSIIAGDALGSVFHGLSEGHIRANFTADEIYPDTIKALKKNESLWRKPALYTSVSQLSVIAAVLSSARRISSDSFFQSLRSSQASSMLPWGCFRHPDRVFQIYIESQSAKLPLPEFQSLTVPIIAFACGFYYPGKISFDDVIEFAVSFTKDVPTVCSALILSDIAGKDCGSAVKALAESSDFLLGCKDLYPRFFSAGINPDKAENSLSLFSEIFSNVLGNDYQTAEKYLSEKISKITSQNITRATVENVYSSIAVAAVIADSNNSFAANTAAHKGGFSTQIASLCGLFSAVRGFPADDEYFDKLINKKRMVEILSQLDSGKIKNAFQFIEEFLSDEYP
ncbi:MAG TPA: ADP-ribosylglycohydrolase family protein, partial [Spirochaetota bacterium]|nr:ADP-ribosylglycohydrolase family protein [Spirochaetota bacterium]